MSKNTTHSGFIDKYYTHDTFEAYVDSVNYERGTCSIRTITTRTTDYFNDVPIPDIAGLGNAGIFLPLQIGSRVTARYTSQGRESVVIVRDRGKENLYPHGYHSNNQDFPVGTISYPQESERLLIRGEDGQSLFMPPDGSIKLELKNDNGISLVNNQNGTTKSEYLHDFNNFSRAGILISGSIKRISQQARSISPKNDPTQSDLNYDNEFINSSRGIGFWTKSPIHKKSIGARPRNPLLSENKKIINEFATDYYFSGFEDEISRIKGTKKLFDLAKKDLRFFEQSNSLLLGPNQLIESIAGNFVDIDGNILDINYKKITYGDNNKVPTQNLEEELEKAKYISRRGIGYHFQLNNKANKSRILNSFFLDLDKEGLVKIKIPKSSSSGNIPYSTNINVNSDVNTYDVSSNTNINIKEKIPVILRNSSGEVVIPNTNQIERDTGIRYLNTNSYFESVQESNFVRIQPTRYHNMYAAGEKIFGAQIIGLNVLQEWRDNEIRKNPYNMPFEIPDVSLMSESEKKKEGTLSGFPNNRITATVVSTQPAISPGGGTVIGGKNLDQNNDSAFANSFEVSDNLNIDRGNYKDPGGKSVFFDLDGSVEASVGADNHDKKSILLDTSGSIVTWLGKDKNNRSLITQTDGDVAINIGGNYDDQGMNIGRFDLRVNVTDKGLIETNFNNNDPEVANPSSQSDFIISISQHGLVISGGRNDLPMIFRNNGGIFIESTNNKVVIKGTEVNMIDASGQMRTNGSTGNS